MPWQCVCGHLATLLLNLRLASSSGLLRHEHIALIASPWPSFTHNLQYVHIVQGKPVLCCAVLCLKAGSSIGAIEAVQRCDFGLVCHGRTPWPRRVGGVLHHALHRCNPSPPSSSRHDPHPAAAHPRASTDGSHDRHTRGGDCDRERERGDVSPPPGHEGGAEQAWPRCVHRQHSTARHSTPWCRERLHRWPPRPAGPT